jgi:large subunit ribosomal protein L24
MLKIKTKLKKDDTIYVISGKEKGKTGKVLRLLPKKNRVIVEKLHFIKRHTKPSSGAPQGGIIEREGSIHITNVALFCPRCNVPVRVKTEKSDDKTIARICIKCNEAI